MNRWKVAKKAPILSFFNLNLSFVVELLQVLLWRPTGRNRNVRRKRIYQTGKQKNGRSGIHTCLCYNIATVIYLKRVQQ